MCSQGGLGFQRWVTVCRGGMAVSAFLSAVHSCQLCTAVHARAAGLCQAVSVQRLLQVWNYRDYLWIFLELESLVLPHRILRCAIFLSYTLVHGRVGDIRSPSCPGPALAPLATAPAAAAPARLRFLFPELTDARRKALFYSVRPLSVQGKAGRQRACGRGGAERAGPEATAAAAAGPGPGHGGSCSIPLCASPGARRDS